jgi:2',3'-cyclic-nucleotide 2'-phosphodiesterase / 3'-nucleotidase / 5'-nucleotidase
MKRGWLALGLLLVTGCALGGGDAGRLGERVVVLGTTDVHGWLLPWDYMEGAPMDRGLARLAPLVDSVRAEHPGRVLLVDSGDLLQGSPMAAAFTPLAPGEIHPVVAAMNLLGYDAAALGNHEFNFGIEHLDQVLEGAEFPFLSANVVDVETGELRWPPYALIERTLEGGPLTVAVIGVLPPGVAVWDRDHVEGRLIFPSMRDQLARIVPEARAAGADLVVVAAHSGLEGSSYDQETTGLPPENEMGEVARTVPGIDAIFLGHSHREVEDELVHGVRIIQAGHHARSLAAVEFTVVRDEEAGTWRVAESAGRILRPDPSRSDPNFDQVLEAAHARTLRQVERVIATTETGWSPGEARVQDTPLMRWIGGVQQQVSGAQLAAVAAFSLSAGLPAGSITVADLARLYPYDNNLLPAVEVDGATLKAYLEHGARYFLPCPGGACERLINPDWPGYNFDMIVGVEYELDLTRPMGDRIVGLRYQGAPVRAGDRFTLALNNYRQGGGGGFPGVAEARVIYSGEESVRDLLIRDLERRGALAPLSDFAPQWRIVPEPLRLRALEEMTGG